MKRPLLYCGIIFSLTCLLAVNLSMNILYSISVSLLTAGLVFLYHKKYLQIFAGILFSFLAVNSVIIFNIFVSNPYLKLSGRTFEVEGLVCNTYIKNNIKYLNCKIYIPNSQGLTKNSYCLLRSFDKDTAEQGQYFKAKIKADIPFSTDTPKHYLSRNIYFTGTLASKSEIIFSNRYPLTEKSVLTNLYIKQNLEKQLSNDNLAIISAMTVGNRNIIDRNLENYLRKSGVIHIIAVSGMHVAIISKVISLIFSFFGINKRLCAILSLPFIWFYGFICGFPPSTVRSVIMITIAIIGDVVFKESDSLNSLGLAAAITLCLNPYLILNVGFQMSYMAVIGIALISNQYMRFYKTKIPIPLRKSGKVFFHSVSAWIFVLPLCAFHFGYLSVLSPIANLLISPFVPLTLTAGLFIGILPASKFLLPIIKIMVIICKFSSNIIIFICKIISSIPFSIITMNEYWKYIWIIGAMTIFLVSCLDFHNIKIRKISVLTILMLFFMGKSLSLCLNFKTVNILCLESASILTYGNNAVILDLRKLPYDDNILADIKNIPVLTCNSEKQLINTDLVNFSESYKISDINAPKNTYTQNYINYVKHNNFYNLENFKYTLPFKTEITYDTKGYYKIKINDVYILKKTENCDIIEDSQLYDIIINEDGIPQFKNKNAKNISLLTMNQGYKIKIYGE